MPKEVKIIVNRLVDKAWPDFEQQVAGLLNAGWVVIGFTVERDIEGDMVYVMLQRNTPEVQPDVDRNSVS